MNTNSQAALAAFEAQGSLQPGEQGWWKVWGASLADVRAGDLILTADPDADGGLVPTLVEETFRPAAYPARHGFVADGARFTIGALCPIVLLRQGTHNTLAGSVR